MSIQTQIERLTGAKTALKTAIEQKGVDVPEDAPLEQYAPLVEQIVGSGGSCYTKKNFEITVDEEASFLELDLETTMDILGVVGGGFLPAQAKERYGVLYLGDSKNLGPFDLGAVIAPYKTWNVDRYFSFTLLGFGFTRNDDFIKKIPISWVSTNDNNPNVTIANAYFSEFKTSMFDAVSKITIQFQNQYNKILPGTKINMTVYGFEVI